MSSALLIPTLSKNAAGDKATLEKAVGAGRSEGALDAKDQARFRCFAEGRRRRRWSALKPMLQTGELSPERATRISMRRGCGRGPRRWTW